MEIAPYLLPLVSVKLPRSTSAPNSTYNNFDLISTAILGWNKKNSDTVYLDSEWIATED